MAALAGALVVSAARAQGQETDAGVRVYPEGEPAAREPASGVLEDEDGRGEIRVYREGEVPEREPAVGILEDDEGRGEIRVYPDEVQPEEVGEPEREEDAAADDVWVPLDPPTAPSAEWVRAERERLGGLSCFLAAKDSTLLDDREALTLCELAASPAPAACFRRGKDETRFRDGQIIDLCQCATSTRPVDCVQEAERDTFLDRLQVIDICRATSLEQRYRDCAPRYGAPARFDSIDLAPR